MCIRDSLNSKSPTDIIIEYTTRVPLNHTVYTARINAPCKESVSYTHLDVYKRQVVDSARRMVIRDRNHACVCIWSLGNEAGDVYKRQVPKR